MKVNRREICRLVKNVLALQQTVNVIVKDLNKRKFWIK